MNWYQISLLIPLILFALFMLCAAILWYQPEARHAPFVAGQVWKNSAGFTMKIATVHNRRWLSVKRTTPEGEYSLIDYPVEDFRRLIIKNRYQLV